jgi:hypothetical protein
MKRAVYELARAIHLLIDFRARMAHFACGSLNNEVPCAVEAWAASFKSEMDARGVCCRSDYPVISIPCPFP